MKTLKEKWAEVCNEYLEAFGKKHELSFEFWVGSDVGTCAVLGDYVVDTHDMRYDIDNDIPEEKFFQWYDYTAELGFLGLERTINYESFCKGAPLPYTFDDIDRVKAAQERLLEAKREFNEVLKEYKG